MSVLRHIEAPCAWSLERAPPRALARRRHRRSFLAAPRALPVRRVAGADRVRAVLDIVRGRKAEQPSDGLEELVDGLRVIRIARPHTQHVLVPRAARQNRATHAMAERELLADERERKLLPVAGGRSLRHAESHLRVRGPPRCGKVACVCVCVCVGVGVGEWGVRSACDKYGHQCARRQVPWRAGAARASARGRTLPPRAFASSSHMGRTPRRKRHTSPLTPLPEPAPAPTRCVHVSEAITGRRHACQRRGLAERPPARALVCAHEPGSAQARSGRRGGTHRQIAVHPPELLGGLDVADEAQAGPVRCGLLRRAARAAPAVAVDVPERPRCVQHRACRRTRRRLLRNLGARGGGRRLGGRGRSGERHASSPPVPLSARHPSCASSAPLFPPPRPRPLRAHLRRGGARGSLPRGPPRAPPPTRAPAAARSAPRPVSFPSPNARARARVQPPLVVSSPPPPSFLRSWLFSPPACALAPPRRARGGAWARRAALSPPPLSLFLLPSSFARHQGRVCFVEFVCFSVTPPSPPKKEDAARARQTPTNQPSSPSPPASPSPGRISCRLGRRSFVGARRSLLAPPRAPRALCPRRARARGWRRASARAPRLLAGARGAPAGRHRARAGREQGGRARATGGGGREGRFGGEGEAVPAPAPVLVVLLGGRVRVGQG